jgi:hypothetical protein
LKHWQKIFPMELTASLTQKKAQRHYFGRHMEVMPTVFDFSSTGAVPALRGTELEVDCFIMLLWEVCLGLFSRRLFVTMDSMLMRQTLSLAKAVRPL